MNFYCWWIHFFVLKIGFLFRGFDTLMSLCCRIFIDILIVFRCVMTFCIRHSIFCRYMRTDFEHITNSFACISWLFSYFKWCLWGLPNQGLIPCAIPLCELSLTLWFHLLSVWVHSLPIPSCNDTFHISSYFDSW